MNTSSIHSKLQEIERTHGVQIIFACESGSRAWGFASPDSDYDIRFLYLRKLEDYLGLSKQPDTLQFDLDADLHDIAGWDIQKALRLFGESNGALLEWLHSPIVYREDKDVMSLWRALVPDTLMAKPLAGHYLGMARKTWQCPLQESRVRTKSYLYALRAVLAARWVLERRLPAPVRLRRLLELSSLEKGVMQELNQPLTTKRQAMEGDTVAPYPRLHTFLEQQLEALTEQQATLKTRSPDFRLLDAFFQQLLLGDLVSSA